LSRCFRQKWGIDYDLTYSPTLDIDNLILILALSAAFHWNIFQLDNKNTYRNTPLDKNEKIRKFLINNNFK